MNPECQYRMNFIFYRIGVIDAYQVCREHMTPAPHVEHAKLIPHESKIVIVKVSESA